MKDKSSISQWQQANELFETYIDKPIEESIALLENDKNIPQEIKVLVIRLLKSLSLESTTIDQADLSLFDSLNETFTDLSGTDIGDYHLLRHIGEGGMAQVYKAERINTNIQKFVAVKILTKKLKLSKPLESLFEKEQVTLSKLTHSNIISFHHGGLSKEGKPYLVMEYINKAQDIGAYIHHKQLYTRQIIELVLPIIDAIGFAHQQLIVHKDIKPSNILVDNHGKPFLLDFGIASISRSKENQEAIHIYTPSYASPEQFLKQAITTSSDIFSFVAMLLDLLTNKKRTAVITDNDYNYIQDRQDIDNILANTALDSDLQNIIKKGMQEQPNQRYQSAQTLKTDLQNWLNSKPISATPLTGRYVLRKLIKRHPLSSFLITVLITAIVFSLTAMFTQMNKAEFEAKKAKQVSDFLIESIQASDPDITKGQEISVKELLNNAKIKIQEASLNDPLLSSSLEYNIGTALAKIGQYNDAEELLLQAIESDNSNYSARLNLAQLYLTQNSYEQSQKQYDYLKSIGKQLDQNQLLQLQQINANQLLQKGEFNEAITVMNSVINSNNINTKQSIESHLILANILNIKGDSKKAVEVLEKTLKLSEESNGKLSTTSTNISNLLADSLTNINPAPFNKLIAIYQQTIDSQIKLYGEKHPLVAKTYLQYGFVLKATGKVQQAKEIATKARVIATNNFGNKHILTAHIDLLISQIELTQNNIEKAIDILKQVVLVYESTYGIDHFETNQVKTTLALYLIRAGQGNQAIEILKSLYTSQKEQLGENHQATLYVVLNLNKAYNLTKNYQKAIDSGIAALAKSQEFLGKEFVITVGLQTVLGQSYLQDNEPQQAIKLFQPLLNIDMVKNNPAYNKKIALLLIQSYVENNQHELAKPIIKQIENKYYSDRSQLDDYYLNLAKFKMSN